MASTNSLSRTITAVIIFTPSAEEEGRAFAKPALADAYKTFFQLAAEHGVLLYRASTRWYDVERAEFRMTWRWSSADWVLEKNIVPDVIYDKAATNSETRPVKEELSRIFPFVNALEFSNHAGSKLLVSQTFNTFAKPYYRVASPDDFRIIDQIPSALVVIKPEQGNSGDGILVVDKKNIAPAELSYPVLIQEFVDSSAGIPGVMKGLHDLRLIFSNEVLVYAYYRTPRPGSYLANVAKGGTQTMVDEKDIPASVWPIIHAVREHYKEFELKIYTVDLIFDQAGTPWIVELNTMPGLYPDESERPHIHKLYLAIIQSLRSAL